MKKRISSLLLAICLTIGLMPLFAQEASAAENYEQAWYPAAHMYVVQIAYESASHSGYNTIDIANITGLSKNDKRVFAPFTGIIVHNDTQSDYPKGYGHYGYVLLQSVDKVRYADGTVDYMTVGFMHDEDISGLPEGKVIKQGEPFYDHGGMNNGKDPYSAHVQISVFKGQFFSVSGPNKDGGYTVGKRLRTFNQATRNGKKVVSKSHGDMYAFDAFSVNTSMTTVSQSTSVGYVYKQNTVSNKNAPIDWSGKWKDLNGDPFPARPAISGTKAPNNLKPGGSFSVDGTISSKTKLLSVTAGVYTAERGGEMKAGKTVTLSKPYHNTTPTLSYKLSKLASSVQFNRLPAGTYWYRVTAANGGGMATLVNAKFTVGNPSTAASPDTAGNPAAAASPEILSPAAGWYTLAPACAPDMRLDVAYSGTSNEDPVWTWSANGTDAQFWYALPDANSHRYYSFVSGVDVDANMVLDVQYGGTDSGTPVWLYESNGTVAQHWLFLDAGDGYCYIVPRGNHKLALAVKDGSSVEGSDLVIETMNGSAGQKWKLTLYQ